jgi:hypothetical protein
MWISGSSEIHQEGNYGLQGIPDKSNMPSSRYDGVGWTDLNGNLWLFGGYNPGKAMNH